ncbi:hypothetical protein GCM10010095_82560 [Streptomyces anthocyanicus]|uniref:Uncharacterized protein n=1 Tax=Streptomyces violaceolatus TaxID=67378 RepID=A0ABN3TDB9_9ACTN|nr:hypothetical protein GCM10010095_82560 [Streptomyces anthocyanicus]
MNAEQWNARHPVGTAAGRATVARTLPNPRWTRVGARRSWVRATVISQVHRSAVSGFLTFGAMLPRV